MDHKISSFSQLHIAEPSPQTAQASPFDMLPPEMVDKVAGNLSAQELSSFGKTAQFSRSVAAPLLGKIISLRNQITALNVATEEGREKAGRLCEAISQLPQAHQAIPVNAMAELIKRIAMQAKPEAQVQTQAQTDSSPFDNALRLTCKLPKPSQPAVLHWLSDRIGGMERADKPSAFDAVLTVIEALARSDQPVLLSQLSKRISGMNQADKSSAFHAVFTAINVLERSDQPAVLNKLVLTIGGMDNADKPTAFDAVLTAIKMLAPSDQPAVLNKLVLTIGGMDNADKPTAFDAVLTAINVLGRSDQAAALHQLITRIGGMDNADKPTAFDAVLTAIKVLEPADQLTVLHQLIHQIGGMEKAGKLQTFPAMFNVIDQLPAHQKAQKERLHSSLDEAAWDLTVAEKEAARGVIAG